ncbi:unnamed protein product [Amoebophrya sp. A120]|nr:unnamed protein product [Amoebophrya sp. A120]|eukprot:GSA120T00002147001.1
MPVLSFNDQAKSEAACQTLTTLLDGQSKFAGGVHVFCACEPDALCALKILEHICELRHISLAHVPATDWEAVEEHIARWDADDSDVPGLLLFIGLGSTRNLPEFLASKETLPEQTKLLCLDAHRPVKWESVSTASDRVYIIEHDPCNAENPDLDLGLIAKKAAQSETELMFDEEEEDPFLDEEYDGGGRPLKRRRIGPEGLELPKDYYLYSWYAAPCACTAFQIAKTLKLADKELLWHAAVGTSMYREWTLSHREVAEEHMEDMHKFLQDEGCIPDLVREALPKQLQAGGSSSSTAPPGRSRLLDSVKDGEITRTQRNMRYDHDLCAFMYRHWNLKESFGHSSFPYGKIRLHKEGGTGILEHMFSEAGLKYEETTEPYPSLSQRIKTKVVPFIKETARRFNIEGIIGKQWTRKVHRLATASEDNQYQSLNLDTWTAEEIVHVITAHLEFGLSDGFRGVLENEELNQPEMRDRALLEVQRTNQRKNFTKCIACLGYADVELFREGLNSALTIQKEIVSKAKELIEAKKIYGHKGIFKHCVFEVGTNDLFRRPMIVRRLALWIMEVTLKYALKKEHKVLPHVLVAHDQTREKHLLVGVSPLADRHEKNRCSSRIMSSLQKLLAEGGTARAHNYDFYDTSVVEIVDKDWKRFWSAFRGA